MFHNVSIALDLQSSSAEFIEKLVIAIELRRPINILGVRVVTYEHEPTCTAICGS